MPTNDITVQSNNNFTLTKILKTTWSSLSAIIGTSTTINYINSLNKPIFGAINGLLYGTNLGIDIKNIININTKNKLLIAKTISDLIIIGLTNYAKFVDEISEPITPTTTPIPFTTTTDLPNITTTTDSPPWPPQQLESNNDINNKMQLDWIEYFTINAQCLLDIGINVVQIINNLKNVDNQIEMQESETSFINNENESLLPPENPAINNYGSNDNLSEIIIFDRTQNAESLLNSL